MDTARHRLGAMEAEFIRSLSAGGPYSSGLDPRGMRATSQLLQAKRVRTMVRVWPELPAPSGTTLQGERPMPWPAHHFLPVTMRCRTG